MIWIRDFQNLGIDKRQVRANRNPIVQETGVLQSAIFAVDVLFIQRPANALRRSTLELTFHIVRMNGSTGVLDHGVAHNLGRPRHRINFYVANVTCK